MKHRRLGLATVLVLGGCSAQATDIPIELSPAQDQALADTLRALIREYAAAWSKVTCESQDSILKYFDWSGPGQIDGTETEVTQYPGDAWPLLLKTGACSRVGEEVGVGTVLVRVFSRDVVSVSWTFQATYFQKDAPPKKARGSVLQIFRRTAEGWKSPVGMSTHQPLASP